MLTFPGGYTWSSEWSAGDPHGHIVERYTRSVGYFLYDHGAEVHTAYEDADGARWY